MTIATNESPPVNYVTHPSQYKQWKLKFERPVATFAADFDEAGSIRPGYKLKRRLSVGANTLRRFWLVPIFCLQNGLWPSVGLVAMRAGVEAAPRRVESSHGVSGCACPRCPGSPPIVAEISSRG